MKSVADTVTAEEVNAIAASLLSYISHYRKEEEALAAAEALPEAWAAPGPTRATSIVACLPAFTDTSGLSTGKPFLADLRALQEGVTQGSEP